MFSLLFAVVSFTIGAENLNVLSLSFTSSSTTFLNENDSIQLSIGEHRE